MDPSYRSPQPWVLWTTSSILANVHSLIPQQRQTKVHFVSMVQQNSPHSPSLFLLHRSPLLRSLEPLSSLEPLPPRGPRKPLLLLLLLLLPGIELETLVGLRKLLKRHTLHALHHLRVREPTRLHHHWCECPRYWLKSLRWPSEPFLLPSSGNKGLSFQDLVTDPISQLTLLCCFSLIPPI